MKAVCMHGTVSAGYISSVAFTITRPRSRVKAQNSNEDVPESGGKGNALSVTVKRKQKQMENLLQEMGMEALEDRLQSATATPANPPHRFVQLIQVTGDALVRFPKDCSWSRKM